MHILPEFGCKTDDTFPGATTEKAVLLWWAEGMDEWVEAPEENVGKHAAFKNGFCPENRNKLLFYYYS